MVTSTDSGGRDWRDWLRSLPRFPSRERGAEALPLLEDCLAPPVKRLFTRCQKEGWAAGGGGVDGRDSLRGFEELFRRGPRPERRPE